MQCAGIIAIGVAAAAYLAVAWFFFLMSCMPTHGTASRGRQLLIHASSLVWPLLIVWGLYDAARIKAARIFAKT